MLYKEETYGRNQNNDGRTGKVSLFTERREGKRIKESTRRELKN